MTQLNHQRPMFKLMKDIRKVRSGLEGSALWLKHRDPVSVPGKKAVSARGKKTDTKLSERDRFHMVALSILLHIDKHGDYSDIARLVEIAPTRHDRTALIEWFCRFSKVDYNSSTNNFSYVRDRLSDATAAMKIPYWTLKPARNKAPFVLGLEIEKLLDRARQRLTTPFPGDEIDVTLIAEVEKALRRR
jgi:hypothetical protein